jgi:hypothetical protein
LKRTVAPSSSLDIGMSFSCGSGRLGLDCDTCEVPLSSSKERLSLVVRPPATASYSSVTDSLVLILMAMSTWPAISLTSRPLTSIVM